jgi:hypothetical protein
VPRNHVLPPDAALAPNVAPGREFWTDQFQGDDDQPAPALIQPDPVDLSKPNLTRESLADQLFGQYLNQGQDAVTARANADARALEMVP